MQKLKKRKWIIFGAAMCIVALAVVLTLVFQPRIANVSNLQLTAGSSSKFTRKQVNDLLQDVKTRQMEYKGCTLNSIAYDEKRSDTYIHGERRLESMPDSYSSITLAIEEYGAEKIAIVFTNFDCKPNAGDGSLSSYNSPAYTYAYDPSDPHAEKGGWVYIDSGY